MNLREAETQVTLSAARALGAAGNEIRNLGRAETVARRVSALEGYDLWAPTYDSHPNPLLGLEERKLKPLLPDLRQKVALDVACGTGRWLERLLGLGASLGVGIDFSPAMLAAARAKAVLAGRLVRGDCLSLPFASRSADLLVCSLAVGHLRDLPTFARELARVARPQADLYVTDLHPASYARGWRTGFRHQGEELEIVTISLPAGQITATFASEGFEAVELLEAHLGEPERPIFVQRGKEHLFGAASSVPALLICHFRQAGAMTGA